MNDIERKEYNELSPLGKKYYHEEQANNPHWSHAQIMAMVMIRLMMNNPPAGNSWGEIVVAVLDKVCIHLGIHCPDVFLKVGRQLGDLAQKIRNGIVNTWESIKRWFQENF